MKRIGTLLSPFVRKLGIDESLALEEIRRKWQAIFREPLSHHMSPSYLKNGELLIHVDTPVWLQQITFFKNDIAEKLQSFNVKEVRFRLGKVRKIKMNNPEGPGTPKVSIDSAALEYIERTVSGIGDPALRDSVRKAMERSFLRQVKTR